MSALAPSVGSTGPVGAGPGRDTGSDVTIDPTYDEAWRELRARLADHLFAMETEDELVVALDDEQEAVRYVRATVEESELWLDSVGPLRPDGPWERDEDDAGDVSWTLDLAQRECDRAADLLVAALRVTHGCRHPAFLTSDRLDLGGLRWERAATALPSRGPTVLADDAPLAVLVEDREHLQQLVDATISEMLGKHPVAHDEDGDVPVPAGESVVWVQVLADRPVVGLMAILVDDIADTEAAEREVPGLQARLPYLQVRVVGDRILVRHEICAVPFAPRQLAGTLARLCAEIDDIAGEVAGRVGGRRFLEGLLDADADDPGDSGGVEEHDGAELLAPLPAHLDEHLATVVELLLDGQVEPSQVAAAYDGQRPLLVRSLVGLRTGTVVVPDVDLDLLLHTLRSGLRHLVDRLARRDDGPTRSRGPRTQQLSLLPEDEPGLDLTDPGRWAG